MPEGRELFFWGGRGRFYPYNQRMEPNEVQTMQAEVIRVGTRVLGTVISVWVGIRDAYYEGIDELERAVCAP